MLADGTTATVKLLAVKEKRDPVRAAVRGAELSVEVNGVRGVLPCATYNLPTPLGGVRIDCPVIKGYLRSYSNYWSIDHDARFRIWPQDGPLIRPGTFVYVGDEVAFLVRSFRFVPPQGDEIWDFGDGSPPAHSRSDGAVDHHRKDGYGTVTHCFKEPGHYVVTVRRNNSDGQWAVDKIDVRVE